MLFQLVLVPVFVCFLSSSFFLLCLLGPCFSIFGRWSTSPDVFCIGGVVPDSRLALLPTANLPVCENRIWNACPVSFCGLPPTSAIYLSVFILSFFYSDLRCCITALVGIYQLNSTGWNSFYFENLTSLPVHSRKLLWLRKRIMR